MGKSASALIVEVGGGEVGSEGAAGLVSEVGWVAVEGGRWEKDEISGVEDYTA